MSERTSGLAFEAQVERILRENKIPFVKNPHLAGITPDFITRNSKGQSIIVEAKNYSPNEESLHRATQQAAVRKNCRRLRSK